MSLPLIESREEVLRRRGLPAADGSLSATFEPAGLDLSTAEGLQIPADVGPRLPPDVTDTGFGLNMPPPQADPISVARAQAQDAARFDRTLRGADDPVAIARAASPAAAPTLGQRLGDAALTGLRGVGRFIDAAQPNASELALKRRELDQQQGRDRINAIKATGDVFEVLAKQPALAPVLKPLIRGALAPHGIEIDDALFDTLASKSGLGSGLATLFDSDLPEVQNIAQVIGQQVAKEPDRTKQIAIVEKGLDLAKTRASTAIETAIRSGLGEPETLLRLQAAGDQSANAIVNEITKRLPKSYDRGAALDFLASDRGKALLASVGITPPAVSLKALEAQATKRAEEGTPGGQLALEEKRLEIETKKRELPLVGTKTVPGQGGLLVGPAAVGGGVKTLVQTPSAGLDRTSTTQITSIEEALRSAKTIDAILKNPTTAKAVTPFIGPLLTGARGNELLARQVPGVDIPQALVDVGQAEQVLANLRIVFRTGASVRETEEPRLLAEIPDRTRDKLPVYQRKLTNTIENLRILDQRQKALLGPGGRQLLSDDEAGRVIKSLPFRFSAASSSAAGSSHIADGATLVRADGSQYVRRNGRWERVP